MPRNSQGLYTLPSGNPVAPNTLIESDWANTTMDDIAEALTNSLPRNGSAPMTGLLTLSSANPTGALHAVPKSYVDSVLVTGSGMPIGFIAPYAGGLSPIGWMLCDGRTLSTTDYPQLYSVIGTTYGSGGVGLFKVPDLRNEFIRGVGGSRTLGSKQAASIAAHNHAVTDPGHSHSLSGAGVASHSHAVSLTTTAGGAAAGTARVGADYIIGPGGLTGEATGVLSAVAPSYSVMTGASGDPGSSLGTLRLDLPDHTHTVTGNTGTAELNLAGAAIGTATTGVTTQSSGGAETVPQNIAMNYYIKATLDGGGNADGTVFLGYFDASQGQNPSQKYTGTTFNSGDWYEISVPGTISVIDPATLVGANTPVAVGGTITYVSSSTNPEGWYYSAPSSGGGGSGTYVLKSGDTMTGALRLSQLMSPDGVDNLHVYGGTSISDGAAVGLNDNTNPSYPNTGALFGGGNPTAVLTWNGTQVISRVHLWTPAIKSLPEETNIHIYAGSSVTDGAAIGMNDGTAVGYENLGALYAGSTTPVFTWSPTNVSVGKPLMLSGPPNDPNEAATKAYVDAGGSGGGGTSDHGLLSGLADDDHTQYVLASGARPITGPIQMQSIQSLAAADNIHIYGGTSIADGAAIGLNDATNQYPSVGSLYAEGAQRLTWSATAINSNVKVLLPTAVPTAANEATTKKYVDDAILAGGGGGGTGFVLKTGDTMTGPLKLSQVMSPDTVDNIHIYGGTTVSDGAAIGLTDSTNTFPNLGALYAAGTTPRLTWSSDNVTSQVKLMLASGITIAEPNQVPNKTYVDTKVPLAGGVMTGLLTLSGDPSANLHAATKQYVDGKLVSGAYVLKTGDTMTGQLITPSVGGGTALNGNVHLYGGTSVSNGAAVGLNNNTGSSANQGALWAGGSQKLNWGTSSITATVPLALPAGDPSGSYDATHKSYVDGQITNATSNKVLKSGDTMTGTLNGTTFRAPNVQGSSTLNGGLYLFADANTGNGALIGLTNSNHNDGATSQIAFYAGTPNATQKLGITATAITAAVPVVLPGNPSTALQAATKQYVDLPLAAQQTRIEALETQITALLARVATLEAP